MDDASRDGTAEILERRAARDSRIRVLRGEGRGPARACERAGRRARGALLARMDADDVALPGRLERQAAWLEARPGVAGCGTGVRYFPEERVGEGYRRYQRWLNSLREPGELLRDLFVECPVANPTLMLRTAAYREVGGYRERDWPEDYDLVLRLHRAGHRLGNVAEPLLRWRLSPESRSRRSERYAVEAFVRCKVHHLLKGFLPPARPLVVWGAGRVGKRLIRELRRQGRAPDALVDLDPRKIGQEIHGAPVLAPEGLPAHPRAYVLGAVGAPGAREGIRESLEEMGRRELEDFRMLA